MPSPPVVPTVVRTSISVPPSGARRGSRLARGRPRHGRRRASRGGRGRRSPAGPAPTVARRSHGRLCPDPDRRRPRPGRGSGPCRMARNRGVRRAALRGTAVRIGDRSRGAARCVGAGRRTMLLHGRRRGRPGGRRGHGGRGDPNHPPDRPDRAPAGSARRQPAPARGGRSRPATDRQRPVVHRLLARAVFQLPPAGPRRGPNDGLHRLDRRSLTTGPPCVRILCSS